MKPLYLALCLLLCTCVRAQNEYQLFRPGVQYLYENPEYDQDDPYQIATQYYGVRVDTLGPVPLYGSLEVDEEAECVTNVPSPFGYSIAQYPDSTVMHFSITDSLVIRQRAPLGERWVARAGGVAGITAEVTAIAERSLSEDLPTTDRVKEITFYGADGTTAIGVPVTISENYGLINGTRFYQLAVEDLPLTLVGTSELPQSLQLPTDSLYGLAQAGDVFQVESNNYGLFPGSDYDRQARRLSTLTVNSVDSITEAGFTYSVTGDLYEYTPAGQQGPAGYTTKALDTTFSYFQPRLPAPLATLQPGARDTMTYLGSMMTRLVRAATGQCGLFTLNMSTPVDFSDDNPCGFDLSNTDWTPSEVYTLGIPFSLDDIVTVTGRYYLRLLYYRGSVAQCGTLLERNDITVPTRDDYSASDTRLSVYPNPATDRLHIDFSTSAVYEVRLYNVAGAQVQRKWVKGSEPATLPVTGLPAGGYLLLVFERGRPVARRRVVIE